MADKLELSELTEEERGIIIAARKKKHEAGFDIDKIKLGMSKEDLLAAKQAIADKWRS